MLLTTNVSHAHQCIPNKVKSHQDKSFSSQFANSLGSLVIIPKNCIRGRRTKIVSYKREMCAMKCVRWYHVDGGHATLGLRSGAVLLLDVGLLL